MSPLNRDLSVLLFELIRLLLAVLGLRCLHGILQERMLEWLAMPKDRTEVSCIAGGFFTI